MKCHDGDPFGRRKVLATVGSVAVSSLAGCLSSGIAGSPVEEGPEVTTTSDSPTPTPESDEFSEKTIERARETGIAVRESVIAMSFRPPEISGTGWYFQEETLLVTAGHLFAAQGDWVAWKLDGTKLEPTKVDNAYLDGVDVGAMRTEVAGPPLTAGDDEELEPGQPLVMVGNPGGVGNWVISLGRYIGKTDGEADGFLTTIPSRGGFSGSPTLTLDGEVVGLVSGVEYVVERRDPTEMAGTKVYGPDDRILENEHVGIDGIVDRIQEWTDG